MSLFIVLILIRNHLSLFINNSVIYVFWSLRDICSCTFLIHYRKLGELGYLLVICHIVINNGLIVIEVLSLITSLQRS